MAERLRQQTSGAEGASDVEVPEWQLELDRVGFVRRLLLARRWYGGDWWFVLLSAILLLFIITVGIFPQWFAPYNPRAEVGPSLLAPGDSPSEYILVAQVEMGVTELREVAGRDQNVGYVVGTPAAQALREALDELNALSAEEGTGVRYNPRPRRFNALSEAMDALAAGELDAVVATPEDVEEILDAYAALEIASPLRAAGDRGFVLGTNQIGQDVLSRIIWGTRIALIVGISSAVAALVIGVPLGLLSGYVGGLFDRIMTLLMDSLYSFPGLILAIAIAAVLGAGIGNIIISIAVLYVPTYYRIVRGQTLSAKEELYVEAARSLGARPLQIMKDYMASGSFARGRDLVNAYASMVFVGNLNQPVDTLVKTSHLLAPFPEAMIDSAFFDRFHAYIPGWEIPKMRPEYITNQYGLIVDYLAEEVLKCQPGD